MYTNDYIICVSMILVFYIDRYIEYSLLFFVLTYSFCLDTSKSIKTGLFSINLLLAL